jgi:hypothetical protein
VPAHLDLCTKRCPVPTPIDLVIDLIVPSELGAPRKAEPAGAEWGAKQATLRWRLGGVYPGYRGAAVAAFRVEGGAAAALAALPLVRAVVRVRGEVGETLTGLQLAQATSTVAAGQAGMHVQAETSEWAAFVLARPALVEGGEWAVVRAPWAAAAETTNEPTEGAAEQAAGEAAAGGGNPTEAAEGTATGRADEPADVVAEAALSKAAPPKAEGADSAAGTDRPPTAAAAAAAPNVAGKAAEDTKAAPQPAAAAGSSSAAKAVSKPPATST